MRKFLEKFYSSWRQIFSIEVFFSLKKCFIQNQIINQFNRKFWFNWRQIFSTKLNLKHLKVYLNQIIILIKLILIFTNKANNFKLLMLFQHYLIKLKSPKLKALKFLWIQTSYFGTLNPYLVELKVPKFVFV